MKDLLHRIDAALSAYAESRGISTDQFRVLVDPDVSWGQVHAIFAADHLPPGAGNPWFDIMAFLQESQGQGSPLLDSLSLTVSTFDQIEAGGYHGIPDGYEDIHDLIATGPAA